MGGRRGGVGAGRSVLASSFYLLLLSLSSCIIISDTCLGPSENILSRTPQMIPNLRFTSINVEVFPPQEHT